jgi:hypothetical protein
MDVRYCAHCLKYSEILFCIDLYGELRGSDIFEAHFKFFKKFEPTPPGSMTTTLIPNGSNSYCIDSDRPSRANLVAWYGEFNGKDILPPKDVMFTIIPPPCSLIVGITACITLTAPKKLVSNCAFISSIEVSSID